MLTKFVTAQKEKLKNLCNKEKNELFSRSEKHLSKCDYFGSPILIISLVWSVYRQNDQCFFFSFHSDKNAKAGGHNIKDIPFDQI